jgi:hypothetical protein
MKKYFIDKMIIIAVSVLLLSCSGDYIDLTPISSASTKNFYKSQADFETAIWSVYADWLEMYKRSLTEYVEFRCDTYHANAYLYQQISTNVFTDNDIGKAWNNLYKQIADANIILDRIDNIEFDPAVKTRIKAEACFARAEAYFMLIRFYGAVPLVTHEISSKEALTIGRAPMDDILTQIETDYKFAVANLPQEAKWDDKYGTWHKYAAEGELARFYVTVSGKMFNKNRWADAKPLMEDILLNSPFEFLPTYAEMFADDGSGEKNKEVILPAVFRAGTGGISTDYAEQYFWASKMLEPGVIESYEAGDSRKEVNISEEGTYNLSGQWVPNPCNIKFDWGYDNATNTCGMDFYVLRYTDVQLMYAETLAEIAGSVTTQALELFNKSRVRAGLVALTSADVPNIATFRLAMEKERRSELMFECVRWFDLVRTGRAVEALRAIGKDASETWLLFPIPQSEIDKVGKELLPQNPGYPGA